MRRSASRSSGCRQCWHPVGTFCDSWSCLLADLCLLDLVQNVFEIQLFCLYVLDLLRAGCFALNADCALIAEAVQHREHLDKVHLTLANQYLLPEFVRIGWPLAVLGMHRLHMRPQPFPCVHKV